MSDLLIRPGPMTKLVRGGIPSIRPEFGSSGVLGLTSRAERVRAFWRQEDGSRPIGIEAVSRRNSVCRQATASATRSETSARGC